MCTFYYHTLKQECLFLSKSPKSVNTVSLCPLSTVCPPPDGVVVTSLTNIPTPFFNVASSAPHIQKTSSLFSVYVTSLPFLLLYALFEKKALEKLPVFHKELIMLYIVKALYFFLSFNCPAETFSFIPFHCVIGSHNSPMAINIIPI